MHWHDFRLVDEPAVDPETGRFAERTKISRMDRKSENYIIRCLQGLGMYAECPAPRTKEEACRHLQTYGYLLPEVQREVRKEWCGAC
jgi:hypothetical protein